LISSSDGVSEDDTDVIVDRMATAPCNVMLRANIDTGLLRPLHE
jgi:hypothetical protein